ncbi:MAG: hypothetical protein ACYSR3_14520 [Planctomycetota bacterium]
MEAKERDYGKLLAKIEAVELARSEAEDAVEIIKEARSEAEDKVRSYAEAEILC